MTMSYPKLCAADFSDGFGGQVDNIRDIYGVAEPSSYIGFFDAAWDQWQTENVEPPVFDIQVGYALPL